MMISPKPVFEEEKCRYWVEWFNEDYCADTCGLEYCIEVMAENKQCITKKEYEEIRESCIDAENREDCIAMCEYPCR